MNGRWEPLPRWTELPGDPAPLRRRLAELRARDGHTDEIPPPPEPPEEIR